MDDKSNIAEIMREHIRTIPGMYCTTAHSSKDAIEFTERHNIDLLIADYDLNENGKNGVDFALSYKKKNPKCKVIIYTGYDKDYITKEDKEKIFEIEPDGFYSGSFIDWNIFIAKIQSLKGEDMLNEVKEKKNLINQSQYTEIKIDIAELKIKYSNVEKDVEEIKNTIKKEFDKSLKKQTLQQWIMGIIGTIIAIITFYGQVIR